jgi:hypothetical protein
MDFTVNTTLKGLLLTQPAKALAIFKQEFKRGLTEATLLLQTETVMRAPVSGGGGFLRRSIGSEVVGSGLDLQGIVGTPLAYALPVEQGAAPHFPWSQTGGLEPIELWVKRNGLSTNINGIEIGIRHVAFLVARKISIAGLQAHWMFRDALAASSARIVSTLERAQARVIAGLQ